MNRVSTAALACLLTLLARPAFADITGFIGTTTSGEPRTAKGAALGTGLLLVGFEFEYSVTDEDPLSGSPSLKTGMGNLLLQTPFAILRLQPYYTLGAGLYREELGGVSDTGFGVNTGGGVKISLVGPVRLRLDYRLFRLGDDARVSPSHRFYAGLNLKF